MKRNIIIIFAITLFGSILFSCRNVDKKPEEIKYLIGKWVLDSTTYPCDKKFNKIKDPCEYIIFKNETDYSYEGRCGDVYQDFTGKYFILNNPKRGLKTLTFIPDITIDLYKDTIRIGYSNFDIVNIDSNFLKVIYETKFIDKENSPSIVFNKEEIYKKIR